MLKKKRELIGEKFIFANEEYVVENVAVYGRYFIIRNVKTGKINEDMKYFSLSIVNQLIENYKNTFYEKCVFLNIKEKEMILDSIKCLYKDDSKKITEEDKKVLNSIEKKLNE